MDRFIGLRQLGKRGAWTLIGIMAIVCVLAYQQYRWIVRVATAEAKTNREKLAEALKKTADDFDTEITRAHLTFAGLADMSTATILQKAAERLQEFRRLSEYPGLIAAMEVTEGLPDPFTIDPGPPPAFLVPVAVIDARGASVAGRYLAMQPFVETGKQLRAGTGAGMRFGGAPLRLRVVLDQDYVARVLLPKLLDRHLGLRFQDRYDVLVRAVQTGKVVRQNGKATDQVWDESRPNIFHPARLPDRPGRSRRSHRKQPSHGKSGVAPAAARQLRRWGSKSFRRLDVVCSSAPKPGRSHSIRATTESCD